MWVRISSIILRYRIAILAVIGLLTGGSYWLARDVEMSYRMADILPHYDKTYKDYDKFRSIFGEEANVITLAVKDPDFFKAGHIKAWMDLESRLRHAPQVEWTLSPLSSMLIVKNTDSSRFDYPLLVSQPPANEAEADSLHQLFASLPFYKELLWSPDSNTYVMLVGLNKEVIHKEERMAVVGNIENEIKRYEQSNSQDVHISGLPFIRTDAVKRARKESILFTILAAIVASIILYVFFKSFRVVGVALLQVIISVIWSWGTMGIMGYKITTLTALIPSLLIVIGIPNAVYMITKYQQEFLKARHRIRALSWMIIKTGRAMFLINLTTAVGFATLIITPGRMLMEFGVVATINCMAQFLLSLVLNPILFSYLPNPKARHTRHLTNKRSGTFIQILVNLVQRQRVAVYIVSAGILIFSVIGMLRIHTSGKVADDVPKNSTTYSDLIFFENNFKGVMPFEIMIDTKKRKKAWLSEKIWKKVDALQDSISTLGSFSRPISYIDLLKYANQSYYKGATGEYRLPNSFDIPGIMRYQRNGKQNRNDSLSQSYVDTSGQYIRIHAQMKDMGTYEMEEVTRRIEQQAKAVFEGEDVEITVSGASVVILEGTKYLLNNLISSIGAAILIIAIMMATMFRKPRMVIISLIPNVLPLLFTAGIMGFFQIPLKASTIIIYGIAFGITVDSTIHFLAKYLQELRYHKGDIVESTFSAIRDTALSMAYTSIILFCGFSVFIGSGFGGTKALGILLSITLLMGFFCNLTLLPALLLTLQGKKVDKDYNNYSPFEDDDDKPVEGEDVQTE